MSTTKYLAVIAGASTVVLALALNPSPELHRAKIKQAIAERSQLERALGVGHLKAFASRYKSLGVASYTTVNERVTSVGVLGTVFVTE